MAADPRNVTRLLVEWKAGDAAALNEIVPLVQDELHRLAQSYMRRERVGHTLQPTALVNEAFLQLVGSPAKVDWQDRAHFIAIAANVMRQILVGHARGKGALKRGAGAAAVSLDDANVFEPARSSDLLAIDQALDRLAVMDARKARVIELRYFGGLELGEIAEVIGTHVNTVSNDLRFGQAWLKRELA